MSGEELKKRIESVMTLAEYGRKMGMTSQHVAQALGVADIKSGLLERSCIALGVSMSFFYPEVSQSVTTNINNTKAHNINTGNGNITDGASTKSNDDVLMSLIKQNSELISIIKDKLNV